MSVSVVALNDDVRDTRAGQVLTDKPSVLCEPDIATVRNNVIELLHRHLNVFHRGGRLVTVVRPTRHDDEYRLLDEPPEIRRLVRASLLATCTEVMDFVKARKTRTGEVKCVLCVPDSDITSAVLEAGEYPHIPQLVGVSETPIVCPDGAVAMCEGYDDETGIYFAPNADYEPVPLRPTRDDARAAYARLAEPFAEFPFEGRELGVAVVVAAILSVLARNAIKGPVPLFLIRKNVRGCGGTLLSDAIAIITTGRNAGRMTMPDEPEELEKVLSSFAIRGAQLVCFDNVHRLGGGPLDKCITAQDAVDLRVLGQSRIETLPWRAVVLANGNNVEIAGDTTRRVLCVSLTSELENPEKRTGFAHPDLRAYLHEHRVQLVRDALVVLSAWYEANRPDVGAGQLGSFEDWSRIVGSAIVFAGGVSPIGAYAEAVGVVDAERQALETLVAEWGRLDPRGEGLTVKSALATLYPHRREDAPHPPDGFEDLREAIEVLVTPALGKTPNSKALGKVIARIRKRVIGGRMFDGKSAGGGVIRWRVVDVKGGLGDLGGFVTPYAYERTDKIEEQRGKEPTQAPQPTLEGEAGCFDDLLGGAS